MLTLLLALSSPAHADDVFPYDVHQTTLDNGLTVYVVPMPTPGATAFVTWMAVGSRDEIDEGRTGFAHFFEHLMFFGTPTLSGPEREREVLRLGIDENAWTWLDETVYHGLVSAENLPRYVEIEADRFQNLTLTTDDVQKESGAVYGEFRKGQASPDNAVDVAVWGTAFTTHTYGHDTIGYEADIAAMPTAHTYASGFFDRYYRPGNAHVLVVGDVQPEQATALVAEHYGSWQPAESPRPEIPEEPEQTELRRVQVPWDTPTTPRVVMGWKIPGHDPADPASAHLALVQDLLFGTVAPLRQRLVRDEGLAYDVSGGTWELVDPGLFRIAVTAREGVDPAKIEAVVREELAALKQVDPDTLSRTASHARYGFASSLDNPKGVAEALGWHLRRDPDPATLDTFYEHYASATPADVAATIDAVFVDERLTIATLVPPASEESP
jgi:zinc protease